MGFFNPEGTNGIGDHRNEEDGGQPTRIASLFGNLIIKIATALIWENCEIVNEVAHCV